MTFSPVKFTKHREPDPNTLSAIKKKCAVIYLCACVFFESFRRDLNEAKAVNISEFPFGLDHIFQFTKYNEICN